MLSESALDVLCQHRLVPVIVLEKVEDAVPLGEALLAGGLPIAEVTFRTEAAAESIRLLSQNPELYVGAGTVLTVDQVKQAVDAGAKFVVSPGFNPKVVQACLSHGIPVFPGVSNPTDIEMGLDHGLSVLKFFPAEAVGGVKMLKAIAAPYRAVKFIPTGGISANNLADYLALPSVVACGGSWMVPQKLIQEQKFEDVQSLIRDAVDLVSKINSQT